MGSRRLTPTIVGKMASKCLFVVIIIIVVAVVAVVVIVRILHLAF